MQFTVKIGKEEVQVRHFVSDVVIVTYKDKEATIRPAYEGWEKMTGTIDQATVNKIGKAIEKYIGGRD